MLGFLLALIATVVVGLGARDQVLVAGLAARQGQRPAVLGIALVSSALAAAGAVWIAGAVAPQLAVPVRQMLAALALGLAGLEMLVFSPKPSPAEPTNSLGAFGIVLLAQQLIDAARFVLFGIVVASLLPGAAGLGGALGGTAVVAIGWGAGQALLDLPLRRIRRLLGAALVLLAAVLVLLLRH